MSKFDDAHHKLTGYVEELYISNRITTQERDQLYKMINDVEYELEMEVSRDMDPRWF